MENQTEELQHASEQEFLAELPWYRDEDTGEESAYFQHGEYSWITVTKLGGGKHEYIISDGDENVYIQTRNYEDFCQANVELADMDYDQYCSIFCYPSQK